MRSGEYQYHDFGRGFALTHITDYGTERVLDVVLIFGSEFEQWKGEAEMRLIAFGKQHGCAALESISRLGMEKALRPLGWKKKRVVLRKEIV